MGQATRSFCRRFSDLSLFLLFLCSRLPSLYLSLSLLLEPAGTGRKWHGSGVGDESLLLMTDVAKLRWKTELARSKAGEGGEGGE